MLGTRPGSGSNGDRSMQSANQGDGVNGDIGLGEELGVVPIAAHGDLVLRIEHQTATLRASGGFKVNTDVLKQHSKYFGRLLQPGRFGEGSAVEAQHRLLRERYQSLTDVPASELPSLTVKDLGRISVLPPISNLANLVIVADRFDALDAVKSYVGRKRILRAIEGKTTAKGDTALSEEKVRQRLLVAVMLEYPPWVDRYSARLIAKGWVGREPEIHTALWWDLPSRIEDELAFRRECALETVQSIQSYFLGLYTSRARQCKLGYDSSSQCDSFQLGEMVRFFTRAGTLRLQGGLFDGTDSPEPFAGDLNLALETLRQVPEYQIDKHHSHCGIRTRLIPLLDLVAECLLHIGICSECWTSARQEHAWTEAKRPLSWKRQSFAFRVQGHGNGHTDLRAMFMAADRDWGH
ncbi:hypothetical protein LTR53_005845 [Teratosphaeriaceae sp. CCFEE 6253]|nr:hypothetical protein LTR53_005845 [Teratosphaeriaceae sp. CCFEE 6253]